MAGKTVVLVELFGWWNCLGLPCTLASSLEADIDSHHSDTWVAVLDVNTEYI